MSISFEYSTVKEFLSIHKYVKEEAEEFIKIIPESMKNLTSADLKEKGITDSLSFSLKDDDVLVAVIEGHLYRKPDHNIIYLRQLTVHPDHRRKGYGTLAVNLLTLTIAKEVMILAPPSTVDKTLPRNITLITENDESVPFWKSLGFEEIDRIEGDNESDRRFKLELDHSDYEKKIKTSPSNGQLG